MIGCKVMRTLASAEFEIILILRLPCCLSSSSVRCLKNVASPTTLSVSTPPTRHAEGLVDSNTPGARSTPSDSTAPLPPDHSLTHASPTLRWQLSSSPPDLPLRKRYRGTSELVEDDKKEEDDEEEDNEEEDEKIEESSDSNSESEDTGRGFYCRG
ncbi:hypothetical protein Tco_0333175 [Tanacetum coccineum]